jgi:hypothetical protein
MSDRTLKGPLTKLSDTLTSLRRAERLGSKRQVWPGRVIIAENLVVYGMTRTSFLDSEAGFSTLAAVRVAAGAWTVHGRVTLSISNFPGEVLYTGREKVQCRLYTADENTLALAEEVDLVLGQPSATPETAYTIGFLDLSLPLFGHAHSNVPFAFVIVGQVVDSETAAHAVTWRPKIMAVPA